VSAAVQHDRQQAHTQPQTASTCGDGRLTPRGDSSARDHPRDSERNSERTAKSEGDLGVTRDDDLVLDDVAVLLHRLVGGLDAVADGLVGGEVGCRRGGGVGEGSRRRGVVEACVVAEACVVTEACVVAEAGAVAEASVVAEAAVAERQQSSHGAGHQAGEDDQAEHVCWAVLAAVFFSLTAYII